MSLDTNDDVLTESLRSRFSRAIRAQLLEKAIERFRQDGYRAATVRSIAKAAGTTHTTFYKFFGSKFQLIIEAGRSKLEDHEAVTRAMVALDPSDWHQVRGWLDRYAELWDEKQAIFEAYWEAAFGEPKIAAEIHDQALHLAGVFRAGAHRAAAVRDEPLTREFALIVMSLSPIMSTAMRAPTPKDRSDILDNAARVLMRLLDRPGGWR